MAKLTKAEFVAQCMMAGTNELSVYVKRGKVKVDANGDVDMADPVNIAFMNKKLAKKQGKVAAPAAPAPAMPQIPREETYVAPKMPAVVPESGELLMGDDGKPLDALPIAELKKVNYQAQKLKEETTLLEIRKDKLNGLVVPTELIKILFMQHSRSITMSFKAALDDIITTFSTKYRLGAEECADLRRAGMTIINDSIEKSIDVTKQGLDGLVREYSLSRGVGERA